MAPLRKFGLEESDDEEYEEQPALKKRKLQTNRSFSNLRASFEKTTPVLGKKDYGYFFIYTTTQNQKSCVIFNLISKWILLGQSGTTYY